MALLRVYLELYIKFNWCLIKDPTSQEDYKDEASARFRQWDFKRLIEQRNLFKKELEVIEGSSKPETFKDRKSEIFCCARTAQVSDQGNTDPSYSKPDAIRSKGRAETDNQLIAKPEGNGQKRSNLH